MWSLAERWCDLTPRIRFGAGALMAGLVLAMGIHYRHQPLTDTDPLPLRQQWRKLMPLREHRVVVTLPSDKPFTVLDFETAESHLVSWQPVGTGGELTLQANWQSIPPLFTKLAERGQAVRGFTIVPAQQRLRVTLQLEALSDG